jgi:transcriptional regulator GlxA family with amidase domain
MRIAVLTFEGFNELDSFVASAMINRIKSPELRALIVCPAQRVASMNGVVVQSQAPLSFAREADAVIVGSGRGTRDIVRDSGLMEELGLDPSRQIIGAQCSGALVLAKLGLLGDVPACTDSTTKPWVEEAGIRVLDQPFVAHGNVATAGGCLGSHYLAAWVIARLGGWNAAESVVDYVAPVGQKQEYVERARAVVQQYLPENERLAGYPRRRWRCRPGSSPRPRLRQ